MRGARDRDRQRELRVPRAEARIGRRTMIVSAAMALLALEIPGVAGVFRKAGVTDGDPLSSFWSDADGARAIGRDYLAQAPEEADPKRLGAFLVEGEGSLSSLSPRELRARIGQRRTLEFQRGDTVLVRGWLLSRTEARLCALAALA